MAASLAISLEFRYMFILYIFEETVNYFTNFSQISNSGGAELLFGKVKKHNVSLPDASKPCKFAHVNKGMYVLSA
jgi:hypothetical protein